MFKNEWNNIFQSIVKNLVVNAFLIEESKILSEVTFSFIFQSSFFLFFIFFAAFLE